MEIGLTGKLISGILIAATTVTEGIILSNSLIPKTIGEEIQSQEERAPLESNAPEWDKLVKRHENPKKPKNVEKIKDLTLNSSEKNKKTEFFDYCKRLWDMKLSTIENEEKKEQIKKDLRNWCLNNPESLKRQNHDS